MPVPNAVPNGARLSSLLGYPFDCSKMRLAESVGNLKLGDQVWFSHCEQKVIGVIQAIGIDVKWRDVTFNAILIRRTESLIAKTENEVEVVDTSQLGFY